MIPLSALQTETFTPPALAARDPKPEFYLRVPTEFDRDEINTRLFALGVVGITPEYVKANLINELYALHSEDEAERLAQIIDHGMAKQEEHTMLVRLWQEQERERLRDIGEGVPEIQAQPFPALGMTPRQKAEYDLLWADTVNGSEKLRRLTARIGDHQNQQRVMIARLHLAGWGGLAAKREAEAVPGQSDIVTPDSLLAVRREIGEKAWIELLDRCFGLYDVSREQVGNFASPPEKPSRQDGSNGRSGASVSKSGASAKPARKKATGSNTGRRPRAGSPRTIAQS